MEYNSLLEFSNPYQFRNFLIELGLYNGWRIESGYMNDRGKKVMDKGYLKRLRKIFREKDLFHMQVSIAEIVSWLDTFVQLDRILDHLIEAHSDEVVQKLRIIIEYKIQMGKNARVDAIVRYDNKFCLLEFRTVNKFDKMKSTYTKKAAELLIYKDLMQNYIEYPSKIICYPFIGIYEYEGRNLIENHYDHNKKAAKHAADYITKFMVNN